MADITHHGETSTLHPSTTKAPGGGSQLSPLSMGPAGSPQREREPKQSFQEMEENRVGD